MSDRDTHFLGFAKLLFREIKEEWNEDLSFDATLHKIIARRAYDLVKHTIESTSHYDLDVLLSDEHVAIIPDLTEWETNE